ncbi:glycosyltransferase [Patescibacteria group bacterium]|nr:glycosyltransferase [Patescibacteria group bacterium]MBU1755017.1 glycosyltransferase [Patescibacteria group bacterium]
MKVLFLGSDPSLFDTESAAHKRMRTYANAIGDLHILSGARKNICESFFTEQGTLTLYGIRAPKLCLPFLLARKAHKIIVDHDIEVISAQDPFEHGRAAVSAARGTFAKVHIQIHTDYLSHWYVHGKIFRGATVPVPVLNRVRRRIAEQVLLKADGIRVVSERIRESLLKKYGTTIPEPSVIPIGVAAITPQPIALPSHQFTFALLAAGRLEPEKRIEDILYAIARIVAEYPSLGLFIVGSGSERKKLERMATGLGIRDRVIFLGERGQDAPGLMASAQAFIQASAYEGYSRTLVEAALARVPIITTDVGIVGEVFKGYEQVLAAPVGDPAALATHIAGLIEDVQARKFLVIEAEKSVRSHLAQFEDVPNLVAADLKSLVSI